MWIRNDCIATLSHFVVLAFDECETFGNKRGNVPVNPKLLPNLIPLISTTVMRFSLMGPLT